MVAPPAPSEELLGGGRGVCAAVRLCILIVCVCVCAEGEEEKNEPSAAKRGECFSIH